MSLMLAKSKAGHDKNHIYVVVGEEQDLVLLANGVTKTCASPKRKKKMHIQPIKNLPEEITGMVKNKEVDDTLVASILDLYNRRK